MIATAAGHIRQHVRFYSACVLGILVWLLAGRFNPPTRLVLAGDGFFAAYILLIAIMASRLTPERLRRRASFEDEGLPLILLITVAALCISLASIFTLLGRESAPSAWHLGLSMTSVFLGWVTLHTVTALHYAHLYYAPDDSDATRDAGGLAFPDTQEPTAWDFLYYAFVVGMTAQVSDVQVLSATMRKLTLAHGVLSFVFNTVLLALAINVAASQIH